MSYDFLTNLKHLGFTARMKRMNERIAYSTVEHYSRKHLGIEPNWHVVFLLLKEREMLTVTEMAAILGFSHPALIKITKKMKDAGYLDSFRDTEDARKTNLELSSKGKNALVHFEQEWFRIETILKNLVSNDFLEELQVLEEAFEQKSFKERYEERFGKEKKFSIRNAKPGEFTEIGQLMVDVYSGLEGFPKADEQPSYYNTLRNIGKFTENPNTELLVAVSNDDSLLGAVLYFDDMQYYGSGGQAPMEKNASGFRLLAVDQKARGMGVGKELSKICIEKAKAFGNQQLIIHTTDYMKVAWKMYKNLGFERSEDLDFQQGSLQVYGFRLNL